MAVLNKYVNADREAGKLTVPAEDGGAELLSAIAIVEVAAADNDLSVYRLFSNIPASAVIKDVEILNDAVTGGTDYDLGFYEPNGGAVVVKDALVNGLSMASARVNGSGVTGLSALNIDAAQKQVFENAGHTLANRKSAYDIALTANTVGTAAGTIVVKIEFLQG